MSARTFEEFFRAATGNATFPFQRDFAQRPSLPELVRVPTGLGKTAMVVLGWLWRRFGGNDQLRAVTPRRLVYCLPMRVLVEQTREAALGWLVNARLPDRVAVHILMGGEEGDEWDIHPERDAIIIGTQDMLLSRALNRGYAASRSRWPMHFGVLHTDCLWVFDEIQLMGSGLATTTQLEAFRRLLPQGDADQKINRHGCCSVWMSATLNKHWLATVDFAAFLQATDELTFDIQKELKAQELDQKAREHLNSRWTAKKPLRQAKAVMEQTAQLAGEILESHNPGTRTIVVVNTVRRAQKLYEEVEKRWGSNEDEQLVLLHSRFRPRDRQDAVEKMLADPPVKGTIVVSTQVIEAGVDVSATTLFTELAPWASLVQRFGRCNRRGDDDGAQVAWIDLAQKKADAERTAPPYDVDNLRASAERLKRLTDVGLKSLPDFELSYEHTHVIRRKDVVDLFDTTPDLAGNEIDIDRFVRDVDESDVRVFWRDYGTTPQETDVDDAQPAPGPEELCPVPIGGDKNPGFRQFAREHNGHVWRWNFLDDEWERADASKIAPGQMFLVHADAGGYSAARGWTGDPADKPILDAAPEADEERRTPDATGDDGLSRVDTWQTIATHTDEVCNELEVILDRLPFTDIERDALRTAARWHDWGKAHVVFQNAIDDGQIVQRKKKVVSRRERPNGWRGCRFVAKAPDQGWEDGRLVKAGWWRRYDWPEQGRKHFRHELASALGVLHPMNGQIPDDIRDLAAYLVAAHHGKVRLSIRSLPNETRPRGERGSPLPECRVARGVRDGDELPATDLGGGTTAPAVTLSLEPMELGLCEEEPFAGQSSWAERMIGLRDRIGPFRLAYVEAILRAADVRASRKAEGR